MNIQNNPAGAQLTPPPSRMRTENTGRPVFAAHLRPRIQALATGAVWAAALFLSAQSGYLFFRELALSGLIVGFVLMVRIKQQNNHKQTRNGHSN